jgi:hypothetical protein
MNNANVIGMPASTNFKPEQALHSALSLDLTDVLVVGYDQDGCLAVRSSHMSRAEAIFLLEKAKEWAMRGSVDA